MHAYSVILAINTNEVRNIRKGADVSLGQRKRKSVVHILFQLDSLLFEVLTHSLFGVLHNPDFFRIVQGVKDFNPCFHLRVKSKVCCRQSWRLICTFAQEFAVIIAALTVRTNKDVLAVLYSPASAHIAFPVCILAFLGERVVIRFLEGVGKVAVLSLSRSSFPGSSKVIVINITLMADLFCPCLVLLFFFVR